VPAVGLVEQYEALRREAVAALPFGPRGHGLALFLARGMPAWLAAVTALGARPAAAPADAWARDRHDPGLLPAARADLTTVLAGMVLACAAVEEVGR
jgi:hypothetical protein